MVNIPNKKEALKHVASSAAAWLRSSTIGEITSLNEDDLTEAEIERLEWAIATIQRRLYSMGGK